MKKSFKNNMSSPDPYEDIIKLEKHDPYETLIELCEITKQTKKANE